MTSSRPDFGNLIHTGVQLLVSHCLQTKGREEHPALFSYTHQNKPKAKQLCSPLKRCCAALSPRRASSAHSPSCPGRNSPVQKTPALRSKDSWQTALPTQENTFWHDQAPDHMYKPCTSLRRCTWGAFARELLRAHRAGFFPTVPSVWVEQTFVLAVSGPG